MDPKVLILIPSRYQSSRFPGKPLSLLKTPKGEITLVEQVYSNCQKSGYETYVVTDHDGIEQKLKSSNMNVLRIDDEVPSGTERIALAFKRNFKGKFDFIINVQGDEPLLQSDDLNKLIEFHQNSDFDIATLVKPHSVADESKTEVENPNIVKVAKTHHGQCLYFSRSPIPYERSERKTWYQHIGVYSYRAETLEQFVNCNESELEKIEGLEQLRALENKMTIGAVETDSTLLGVDTPEDLEKVNAVLSRGES